MNEVAPHINSRSRHDLLSKIGRKVPEITVYFWVIKVLTTAMGESASDFLVRRLNPAVAVAIGALALAGALVIQLRATRYEAVTYWLTVSLVAVFGTMAADVLHVGFGIPYIVSSIFFAIILAAVFIIWYRVEGTLSIHSIDSRRRELFYWATVMATFALGTATGDLTATTLQLGYFSSGLLFTGLIAIPALAYRWFGLNAILAFWLAYILTRPLGASFADWAGKSHHVGGLGWGDGPVSLALTALIILFVGYLKVTRKDTKAVN